MTLEEYFAEIFQLIQALTGVDVDLRYTPCVHDSVLDSGSILAY
jgi:hypothetical protein